MINLRLIYKILGQLLFIEASFMMLCLVMAFSYHEDDQMAFIISMALTLAGAISLKYFGREAENALGRRDAYIVVTLTWVVFSVFGALPYLVGGFINSPTNAFFETMSGFTTTGASIIDDVESLPHGILFWRSLSQWIGALGIVFFTIAVMPSMVGGTVRIFAAEATGPIRTKLHPRLSTNAKWIWSIYLLLTTLCAGAFLLGGMDWFDSINYSMSTTATGGFSTHNASVGFFHSPTLEYLSILFQFLSGLNFTLLYLLLFKGRIAMVGKSSEVRLYVAVVTGATLFITALLVADNGYTLLHALRSALFQVVSCISTTGLFSDDAGKWPHLAWVVLFFLMFLGACSGSTSSGFKCIRGVMVLKIARNEIRRILHPRAILPVKINGQNLPSSAMPNLIAFIAIFIFTLLFTQGVMIASGIDGTNAIMISLSCISNVGAPLGTGIGPVMAWSQLPVITKWICSLLMLMGRLEIFSVLVLFTPSFWKDQ